MSSILSTFEVIGFLNMRKQLSYKNTFNQWPCTLEVLDVFNSLACWVILHSFLFSADIFFKINLSIKLFQELRISSVSNSSDPDSVRLQRSPNCLQMLSVDHTCRQ